MHLSNSTLIKHLKVLHQFCKTQLKFKKINVTHILNSTLKNVSYICKIQLKFKYVKMSYICKIHFRVAAFNAIILKHGSQTTNHAQTTRCSGLRVWLVMYRSRVRAAPNTPVVSLSKKLYPYCILLVASRNQSSAVSHSNK